MTRVKNTGLPKMIKNIISSWNLSNYYVVYNDKLKTSFDNGLCFDNRKLKIEIYNANNLLGQLSEDEIIDTFKKELDDYGYVLEKNEIRPSRSYARFTMIFYIQKKIGDPCQK